MAKTLNAASIAQQWATRVSQSGTQFKAGVQAVTQNPCAQAAAQSAVWAANVAASQQKYTDNLNAVSLQSWQQSTANAVNSYTGSTQKGQPKVQAFMTQFIPAIQSVESQLAQMPRGNYQQNLARLQLVVDQLHAFKYKK